MSDANDPSFDPVERGREAWDAFERDGLNGWGAYCHADLIYDSSAAAFPGVEPVYHGVDGMREVMEQWIASFEGWRIDLVENTRVSENTNLAVLEQRGIGSASGAEVTMRYAQLLDWEDGLVRRMRVFIDVAEARRVAAAETDG